MTTSEAPDTLSTLWRGDAPSSCPEWDGPDFAPEPNEALTRGLVYVRALGAALAPVVLKTDDSIEFKVLGHYDPLMTVDWLPDNTTWPATGDPA